MISRTEHRRGPVVRVGAVVGAFGLLMAACGSDGSSGDEDSSSSSEASAFTGEDPSTFTMLTNVENQQTVPAIELLAAGACSAEEAAQPIEASSIPQGDLDAQIQLLASQDGLPAMFSAAGTPSEGAKLWEAGKLVDFEEAMTELGVLDSIEPAAISTIEKLYGGAFNFLPYQFNIEGIFYNKVLFEEYGVSEPQTWDELLAAADIFQAAGITPLSASGEQGWPITRLLSGHIFRSIGPDALSAVEAGTAKLTDPEYIASAQAIADLGAAGYFGENVTSLDYDGATNEFLTGNAAMMYMGTWLLGNINDPEQNLLPGGPDDVGFMPYPAVEGGAGAIDQYPANVGLPATFAAETFGDNTAAWLACIAENFGSTAMSEFGTITGFKLNQPVDDVPQLTQEIQERIANGGESVLWMEALFNAKAGQDSSGNIPLLVTGEMTAEEFMTILQTDLDNG